jgi:LDH2 family malate/lactate/ureidoglycolate dehydrogenase
MGMAVAKARQCGVGAVVVRGGTHYGSSAVHVNEAVQHGCLGIAMTNAGPEMAAWGGATPMVGTNPWGIGAPSDLGFPVILDIALTTAGKGMMRWHAREGQRMPRDWALTPDGEETDDPAAAMAGALLGIGQYKGYGLSLMTDAMTGVLSGGAFGRAPYADPMRQDVSHTFLAFDIGWFMPPDDYRRRLGDLARDIRTSRLRPGFSEVLMPGELEHRRAEHKRRAGVPLDAEVFAQLNAMAAELGIPKLVPA